jgi:hypothetical protein
MKSHEVNRLIDGLDHSRADKRISSGLVVAHKPSLKFLKYERESSALRMKTMKADQKTGYFNY